MAETPCTPDCAEYRIAAVDPVSHTALVTDQCALALPSVRIPLRTRTTQRLQQSMKKMWELDGVVVEYAPADDGSSPCAVVELLPGSRSHRLRPVALDRLVGLSRSEKSLLASCLGKEPTSPLVRFGWIHEAVHWVEETADERIRSLPEIQQFNAGAGFALLRFPMQSGRYYWLKATGKPNFHELEITTFLSKLCPVHLPSILDANSSWNAWITAEKATANVARPSSPEQRFHLLMSAAEALAEIQIRSAGREKGLLTAGAFDQRIDVLRKHSALLFQRIGEAMELQTSTKAPRLDDSRLRALQSVFEAMCDFLLSLPIPASVIHGDMNEGNLLSPGVGACQLIDWSEAFVGHPLVTLEHLLLLNNPTNNQLKQAWDQRLVHQYRSVMSRICDPEVFDQAFACMPVFAAASAMYGRGGWLSSPIHSLPHRQPWVRMLARYMDRAAQSLQLLRVVA